MRLCALYSGGKDSTYAMYLLHQKGYEFSALISVVPESTYPMLFHSPAMEFAELFGEALGIEQQIIRRLDSMGEEEMLYDAVRTAYARKADGLVTGAILSDYQHARMDAACSAYGLRCFSPLWRKSPSVILRDIVDAGIEAVITSVSAEGLGEGMVGRRLDMDVVEELLRLHEEYGLNTAGEGGEYETLVLDSPMHRKKLAIEEWDLKKEGMACRMVIGKMKTENK